MAAKADVTELVKRMRQAADSKDCPFGQAKIAVVESPDGSAIVTVTWTKSKEDIGRYYDWIVKVPAGKVVSKAEAWGSFSAMVDAMLADSYFARLALDDVPPKE